MSDNKNFDVTKNEEVGVNTPERTDEMDENKEFFNEDKAEEPDVTADEMDDEDLDEDSGSTEPEKVGVVKRFFRWVGKRKKVLIGFGIAGLVIVVGGTVYCYVQGKKPIKIGSVEDMAKKLSGSDDNKVVNFAEEAKKLAEDMAKNPENYEVTNF